MKNEVTRREAWKSQIIFSIIILWLGTPAVDFTFVGNDGTSSARGERRNGRTSDPGAAIAAMTANAFEEDRRKCMEAGMDGFVVSLSARNPFARRWIAYSHSRRWRQKRACGTTEFLSSCPPSFGSTRIQKKHATYLAAGPCKSWKCN